MIQLVRPALLVLLFVAVALGITLVAAGTLLGIPSADLPAVAVLFAQVGIGVGLLALLGMQPRVLQRIGGVRAQLVAMSLLGSLLLLGLMLTGARAMFLSEHDLTLLLTMAVFVAQLAVGVSLLWTTPLARRIEGLPAATACLATGAHPRHQADHHRRGILGSNNMEPKERLLGRLEAISRSVAHHEGALAVFGLGSVGSDLDRLDAYSDVDVLVVVQLGSKQAFLDNLDWLSAIHPIAYAFKVTDYTYKLLYADGIFCEVDVLEAPELATHPFAARRLIWQAPNVDLPPLTPPHPRGPVVRTEEWLVGEILTNLYVGLQRYRRGEKLSAFRFVQGYAIDRIIELSPLIELEQSADLDPFIHERRYEQRFPQTAHELSRFVQGYERTPESALAILDFMSRHFAINPAMQQVITNLLQA